MGYRIECVVAPSGNTVAPCASVDGVAHEPVMVVNDDLTLDFASAPDLYVWALSFPVIVFVVGFVVGSLVRVIRSA